ncbi:DUF296 domain-containing protein [Aerococcaceae bacterium DSM 111021]|nr:DUF296 domain-containing protein [Aerococcaceae bacterium DSM 111021]
MDYRRFDQTIVLRLDRGDKVKESIQLACEKEQVTLATVSGIGATESAKIGIFDIDSGDYKINEFNEFLELTALLGNVTQMDGAYYGHFHATFGDNKGIAFGGDLDEAIIGGAGEVFIHIINGSVERSVEESTGLNVLNFDK